MKTPKNAIKVGDNYSQFLKIEYLQWSQHYLALIWRLCRNRNAWHFVCAGELAKKSPSGIMSRCFDIIVLPSDICIERANLLNREEATPKESATDIHD